MAAPGRRQPAAPNREPHRADAARRLSPSALRSGSWSIRGRSSPRAATAGCTSRFSMSVRAMPLFVVFPRGSTLLVDAGGPVVVIDLRHRRSRRRARPAGRGSPAARLPRAHAWRSRSHRRRAIDPPRVPAARSVGGDSGAAVRAAHALRADAQAVGARWANVYAGDRVASTVSTWSRAIRRRRTGSGRRSGTTIRSCWSCAGATSRWC